MKANRKTPLAHSASKESANADPYSRHVKAVREGAYLRGASMFKYASGVDASLLETLRVAAEYHDLGKLDDENQAALAKGRNAPLPWDHIDAGVAHLTQHRNRLGAWLVRAHHAPGLPAKSVHFADELSRRLRGRRSDDDRNYDRHAPQIARTDTNLAAYIALHAEHVDVTFAGRQREHHGLTTRLLLSCLVDADHADTALFDTSCSPATPPEPLWDERLSKLKEYVRALAEGSSAAERERNKRRSELFDACLAAPTDEEMVACEAPVGMGKTTAVLAYLLRQAQEKNLRRIVLVAPYTTILSQTASALRRALRICDDEDMQRVVVEHHHQAEFDGRDTRELAVLWNAPIVLTTAVTFFETLAACRPSALRKLHALPGSAVFIDEAHAAMPAKLWPQNWKWLTELSSRWGCTFVFASGTLVKFWEHTDIVEAPRSLRELMPLADAAIVYDAERRRIRYEKLSGGPIAYAALSDRVIGEPGPRLVIFNTVHNAARFARTLRDGGHECFHISTALTPKDRKAILKSIQERLLHDEANWTLVATSCVEAGVDLSFRCAFRERCSVASIIQVGGRVNRNGKHDYVGGGTVFDFVLEGASVTTLPGITHSTDILNAMLEQDVLNRSPPSEAATAAMREEMHRVGPPIDNVLMKAELGRDYPSVSKVGRVIAEETCTVVVDPLLKLALASHERVSFRDLLGGSVQLWPTKIEKYGIKEMRNRDGLYEWDAEYDGTFLGIMESVLNLEDSRIVI